MFKSLAILGISALKVEAENDVEKEDPRADRILEPTSSGRTRYRPKKFT